MPPRLGKQYGFFVTSINLNGSQNPTLRPILTKGGARMGHEHIGDEGFFVSGLLEGQTETEPIEIGNKQDQQMSVMGLTNFPPHCASCDDASWVAKTDIANRKIYFLKARPPQFLAVCHL